MKKLLILAPVFAVNALIAACPGHYTGHTMAAPMASYPAHQAAPIAARPHHMRTAQTAPATDVVVGEDIDEDVNLDDTAMANKPVDAEVDMATTEDIEPIKTKTRTTANY